MLSSQKNLHFTFPLSTVTGRKSLHIANACSLFILTPVEDTASTFHEVCILPEVQTKDAVT
jgi:hypothetical protein